MDFLAIDLIDKEIDLHFFRQISNRLLPFEIATISDSSKLRLLAVQLARAGNTNEAEMLIKQANKKYVISQLSREAKTFSEVFQFTTHSYIEYKKEQYSEANQFLLKALQRCQLLTDSYDYDLEPKRLGIVKNIIQIKSSSKNYSEALEIAINTLRYLAGEYNYWPFPLYKTEKNPSSKYTKFLEFFVDKILAGVDQVLTETGFSEEFLRYVDPDVFLAYTKNNKTFFRLYLWFAVKRSIICRDLSSFFSNISLFISEDPGYMQAAWRSLALDFIRVSNEINSEIELSRELQTLKDKIAKI